MKINDLNLENVDGKICIVHKNKRGNIKTKLLVDKQFLGLMLLFDNGIVELDNSHYICAMRKMDREQEVEYKNYREIKKRNSDIRAQKALRTLQYFCGSFFRGIR